MRIDEAVAPAVLRDPAGVKYMQLGLSPTDLCVGVTADLPERALDHRVDLVVREPGSRQIRLPLLSVSQR